MPAYEELLNKYAKRKRDTVMDSVTAGLSYADNVAVDFGLLEESGLIDSLTIAAPFAVIAVTDFYIQLLSFFIVLAVIPLNQALQSGTLFFVAYYLPCSFSRF